jgi:hypothetical protein
MKRVFVIVVALGILAIGAQVANAQQVPYVMLYFDDFYVEGSKDCSDGQVDSAFVVAKNFDLWLQAIEYKVDYPLQMIWISDDVGTSLAIGSTPVGIAQSWPLPQNAYEPYRIAKVIFLWNCFGGCVTTNVPVTIEPHPDTFKLRALRWPDLSEMTAIGMTSLVCATIPVEETSWGQIKALYK